jgi:ZIP family zinc transporter
LGLSAIAGLATGAGSLIALFAKKADKRFLSCALGLSAGVMVYISLFEMLGEAHAELGKIWGERMGSLGGTAAFFAGMLVAMLIDRLIPAAENPHEVQDVDDEVKADGSPSRKQLLRGGILFAIAVTIHNFPEGMAVFTSASTDPVTGLSIALAIAIHNIPEGITVSVPIYHATGSKKKAFCYSFLSGLAEPVGALAAWLFLLPFLSPALMALTFAAVAGIMVFISFDELLPLAEEYGEHHLAILGLIGGMLVMALTLVW